jgi:multiple sugar transport system permease protein
VNQRAAPAERDETRLAWLLVAPALAIVLIVALVPIAVTGWEALHVHDLRLPWLGTPFIGAGNFVELMLGLALAVMMHSVVRGRAFIRVSALLPWAIPTVVAALLWRFMFEARTGVLAASFQAFGLVGPAFDWFVHPLAAWVPIIAADVWKTTPFVAILLLAGLETIDPALGEAARIDGASRARAFLTITLPLLTPALVVAAAFRMLDALRLFDLAYVVTGGGPGTATEPLSLYAFIALMQRLRFGYGSALSVIVFLLTFAFALVWVRALGRSLTGARS